VAHILIVEDEPDIAELFGRHLESKGHTFDVAADGLEGQRAVFQTERDYDLILCDLKMRHMSGKVFLDLVHEVIKDKTPVVVVSGWPHLVEALGIARRRAFMILNKPRELRGPDGGRRAGSRAASALPAPPTSSRRG